MNRLLTTISAFLLIFNFVAADTVNSLTTAKVLIGTEILTVHANSATYTINLNSYTNEANSATQATVPTCTFQPFTLTAKLGDTLVTKTITNAEETVVFDADLLGKKNRNVIMRLGSKVITVPASTNTVTIHPESFDEVVRQIFCLQQSCVQSG
ncbi:hypothetical protein K450DRAFT_291278 [Umbelopsis ramanniana AG]|uniref:Uncharacterized protein n=1 Tax=Umbelopsis ramanniana AG TaxID=1314678 RepID=A0AAD5E4J8_UMBRA|nr:uncharacterized protein K450DRAFT_291278 [Umbelopsis ramanniana AG]KAI8576609.1 hypothetical protein K450DRAFT_291278 [Umbelopsis ramanniana AG]